MLLGLLLLHFARASLPHKQTQSRTLQTSPTFARLCVPISEEHGTIRLEEDFERREVKNAVSSLFRDERIDPPRFSSSAVNAGECVIGQRHLKLAGSTYRAEAV